MSGQTALLLIDCQEDFLAREGLQPPRETLVASIVEALAAAREMGWPVIHVRTRVAADGADAMPHRRSNPEVVAGTAGVEPPVELAERDGEPVYFKRFFSAFDADGLDAELMERGVTRLLITGVHSHACVQASVLDAYARGFEVSIAPELVASYDPAHGQMALDWLAGRAATVGPAATIFGHAAQPWQHRNPCDWDEVLGEIAVYSEAAVAKAVRAISGRQPLPLSERASRLRSWHDGIAALPDRWIDALVRDLGKPRIDAEGELAYGLALLDRVAETLADEEADDRRRIGYRPHGIAGLVTPWNNPFAIPVAKLAPAIGYGNAALWKPALPGSRIAEMLRDSLAECGLGDWVALVTGDSATGRAVVAHSDLVSFTGSVGVGRLVIADGGRRGIPVQAEMGGSNAAIVDSSADLDAAAEDLAAAMFSFAGQRCTAVRRLLVLDDIYDPFVERLTAAVAALQVGYPADGATQVGPVIDRASQRAFLAMARGAGASVIAGADIPPTVADSGCWVMPTLLADLQADHPLLSREVFGPLAAIVRVPDLATAIAAHNGTTMGLLGALFSEDEKARDRFLAEAQAGMLSINRARPSFAADGPFFGWKASGHGIPEHGRWNRDFYSRVQAIYGR